MTDIVQIKDIPDKKGNKGVQGEEICLGCYHTRRRVIRTSPKRFKCHVCGFKDGIFVQGYVTVIHFLIRQK